MILNNATEFLLLEMSGRSFATLKFIILILNFNNHVGKLSTHRKHIVGQM